MFVTPPCALTYAALDKRAETATANLTIAVDRLKNWVDSSNSERRGTLYVDFAEHLSQLHCNHNSAGAHAVAYISQGRISGSWYLSYIILALGPRLTLREGISRIALPQSVS